MVAAFNEVRRGVTFCPTCAGLTGEGKEHVSAKTAPLQYCSELCELKRSGLSTREALKVQAMRRNTEALERLADVLQAAISAQELLPR